MRNYLNLIKKTNYCLKHPKKYRTAKCALKKMSRQKEKNVFILTCGPSLHLFLENDFLRKYLTENYCVSIKQAFDFFPKETDRD